MGKVIRTPTHSYEWKESRGGGRRYVRTPLIVTPPVAAKVVPASAYEAEPIGQYEAELLKPNHVPGEYVEDAPAEVPAPKRRGRPPKKKPEATDE